MKPLFTKYDFITGKEHFTKPKIYVWNRVIEGYGGVKCVRNSYEKYGNKPQTRGLTKALREVWDYTQNSEKDLEATVKNLSSIWNKNFNQILMYFEGGYGKLDETFNTNPLFPPTNQSKKINKDPKFILKYAESIVDEFDGNKNSINQLITILQTRMLS